MAKMKSVKVEHCKPMRAGGLTKAVPVPMPAVSAAFKAGGMTTRGHGCAVKGFKATGSNG